MRERQGETRREEGEMTERQGEMKERCRRDEGETGRDRER